MEEEGGGEGGLFQFARKEKGDFAVMMGGGREGESKSILRPSLLSLPIPSSDSDSHQRKTGQEEEEEAARSYRKDETLLALASSSHAGLSLSLPFCGLCPPSELA